MRYINRIELPLPLKEFRDFVLTVPEIASGLPSSVSAMAMQLVVQDPATGGAVMLNQCIDQNSLKSDVLPLIFDIDAFKEVDLASDAEDLWTFVEQLRKLKNEFFFKSITEKTKELFR